MRTERLSLLVFPSIYYCDPTDSYCLSIACFKHQSATRQTRFHLKSFQSAGRQCRCSGQEARRRASSCTEVGLHGTFSCLGFSDTTRSASNVHCLPPLSQSHSHLSRPRQTLVFNLHKACTTFAAQDNANSAMIIITDRRKSAAS